MNLTRADNLVAVIRALVLLLIVSFVAIVALAYMSITSKTDDFVTLPASRANEAATQIEKNVMNKTNVYDFTVRTFQSLHRWRFDGEQEYAKNIKSHASVITPRYMQFLKRDFKRRKGAEGSSQLRNRTRMLIPMLSGWDDGRVKVTALSNGKPSAWIVFIDMELIEQYKGQELKHLYLRYPIRVVLDTSDSVKNPALLMLDGYQDEPKKLSLEQATGDK